MNVQIRTVHFEADSKLMEHVNSKISKLSTYYDQILSVEVYLQLDNVVHQIKDKVAEIKVHIPKHTLFVKHESKSFEESFDLAYNSMVTQIKRRKEKMTA
jgi:putative sigma-54 modulation protein